MQKPPVKSGFAPATEAQGGLPRTWELLPLWN